MFLKNTPPNIFYPSTFSPLQPNGPLRSLLVFISEKGGNRLIKEFLKTRMHLLANDKMSLALFWKNIYMVLPLLWP